MKKIVRNLVILGGVVAGAVLVKKVVDTKKETETEKENENSCFCSWEKIEESTGFNSKNKKLKKNYQQ